MTAPPPSSSVPQFEPGALLAGKYRVERLLGKGGMGAVYAAQHKLLAQRVAVKLLLTALSGNPEGLQRFLNEARAAARLDSEHVARVMDVGTLESGQPYMVLEYLEGAISPSSSPRAAPCPCPRWSTTSSRRARRSPMRTRPESFTATSSRRTSISRSAPTGRPG